VELDAAVLEAATAAMGLPTDRRALPHSLTRPGGRSAPLVPRLRRPCWRLPGGAEQVPVCPGAGPCAR